ncbi:hypothetical protein KVT40_007950 [Elsinoe batatas]|uniref:Uncharacterized protein n=1 Tax=Elsinoe batatas TaxID=2601811 RepID=A0A8K0KUG8_9PEZI|nr:hypothetical protein KVT40_007950 [Elsinoe batatas]
MDKLNTRARSELETYNLPQLFDTLDWSVQDDRATLGSASIDQVRERFKLWRAETVRQLNCLAAAENLPRFNYCLHVDEAALRSVVDAPAPPPPRFLIPGRDPAKYTYIYYKGYVNLINAEWDEEAGRDSGIDGRVVDGKTYADVGHCRVVADWLVPGTYWFLSTWVGWTSMYRRPPEITCY